MTADPAAPDVRPTLSVVVPTYREAANIPVLLERLQTALAGLPWEMIVVDDDSPDGTADVAYAIAARDPRPRCLTRIDRTRPGRARRRGMARLQRRSRRGHRRRPPARRNDPAENVCRARLARHRSGDRHASGGRDRSSPVSRTSEAQRARRVV